METKYQVIPLFPTPLYVNEVPEQLVNEDIPYFEKEELINLNSKEFGFRSKNSYILDQNQYQNLNTYILQHATNYAENYMGYDYTKYKFSQSWISVKFPNEKHTPHSHQNSLISGVLFYGDFKDTSSSIIFYRSDGFSKTKINHLIKPKSHLNGFSYCKYEICYKPNLLILFPSYLQHSVSENLTDIPRKSLAFNVVPKNGFGSEDRLNELKFN